MAGVLLLIREVHQKEQIKLKRVVRSCVMLNFATDTDALHDLKIPLTPVLQILDSDVQQMMTSSEVM